MITTLYHHQSEYYSLTGNVTFDGKELLIKIKAGVRNLSIADIYSDWKEWKLVSDNAKYPPAFLTVGGESLTPGIRAGTYYFIQNQFGWRIKPPEEDADIFVTGNLAPQDSTIPVLTPTIEDFTVLLQGLQPITQSVNEILSQSQDAAYQGKVFVDFNSNNTGVRYPVGTATNPVNNVTNAFAIADRLGVSEFQISNGIFELDRPALSYIFTGRGGSPFMDINGFNVTGSVFNSMGWGQTDFGASGPVTLNQCTVLGDISNFSGIANQCSLGAGVLTFDGNTSISFSNSINTSNDTYPIFDFQGANVEVACRSWSGDFEVKNMTDPLSNLSIDMTSGRALIANSNTAGEIVLRGIGVLRDNNAGTTLDREGFIEGEDIIQLRRYIYFDSINGVSGTTEGVGTINNPVNNVPDAFALAAKRGFKEFKIIGEFILDRDASEYVFESTINKADATINLNSFDVNKSSFIKITMTGNGTGDVLAQACFLDALSGVSGSFFNCGLNSAVLPGSGVFTEYVDCYSEVPGAGTPVLDLGDTLESDVQLRRYAGGLLVTNCDTPSQDVSIDLTSGRVQLDPSCIDGTIIIRGSGYVDDFSNGSTVITKGLIGNAVVISAYNDEIVIDPVNGQAGTDFPFGLRETPVNNWDDAVTLSQLFKITKFRIVGTFVIPNTADISFFRFIGDNPITAVLVITPGAITTRTSFESMIVTGALNGPIYAKEIGIDNLANIGDDSFPTVFDRCILRAGTLSMSSALASIENVQFIDCVSADASINSPTIDMNNSLARPSIRRFTGGLRIINLNQTVNVEIQMTGNLILENTCTDGTIDIEGIGTIENNGTTVINRDGFIEDLEILNRFDNTDSLLTAIDTVVDDTNTKVTNIETNQGDDSTAITNIESAVTNIDTNVDALITSQNSMSDKITRILGMVQQNFRITNQIYDVNNNMTSAKISIFNTANDTNLNQNPIQEYQVTATYDQQGRMNSYRVVEI